MDPLRLLLEGELEIHGRLVVSSNDALFCSVRLPGDDSGESPTVARAVYKPIRFERPLWDFPDGTLAQREVAAYLVSEATGWGIVPPTVLRDGPAGLGMVQLWIDGSDPQEGDGSEPEPGAGSEPEPGDGSAGATGDAADDPAAFHAIDPRDAWELVRTADPRLRPMAIFDAVVNNTDRKGGHILPVRSTPDGGTARAREHAVRSAGGGGVDQAGDAAQAAMAEASDGGALHLYGVDHGVCFSIEPKLRTVLWAWRGTPLAAPELAVLFRLRTELDRELGRQLRPLLAAEEIRALRARIDSLLTEGCFPQPRPDRPAIPWPPF